MFVGVTALALWPRCTLRTAAISTGAPKGYEQRTVITQVGRSGLRRHVSVGFIAIAATTALILVLAANTAFNGFPVLGSILAQDRYLPRQLHTRGDRLAFSNGIVRARRLRDAAHRRLPGRGHPADPALHHRGLRLVRAPARAAWCGTGTGCCAPRRDPQVRRRMRRSQAINMTGAILTGTVLVIVLLTKFTRGAWIVLPGDADHLHDDEGDPPALRPGRRASSSRSRGRRPCRAGSTRSCW